MTPPSLLAVTAEAVRNVPAGRSFRLRVSGTSMLPALQPGDEVVAERDAPVSLGDLVVIDLPDAGLVVHRFLWRGRIDVRTRGDATGRMDVPVKPSGLLGRVREVWREGREVTPSRLALRAAWLRDFPRAAAYRIGRNLAAAVGAD